ncbi:MAG: BrnT family toxin [Pseudomonadales bacterium]|nr:BrnT family toxin [Pseudomonadales bacterium]
MTDCSHIVGFDWGAGNAPQKRRQAQAEAEQVSFNQPLLILSDSAHSSQEQRYHVLGSTDRARTLHITFTLRVRAAGTMIRVISARDMHRKERVRYEQVKTDS